MKYTAKEIVVKTGIENPESVFGNVAVNIGGIAVNQPDHVINTQDAEKVSVIIGSEIYEVALPEEDPLEMSAGLKEIRDAEMKAALATEPTAATSTEAVAE